MTQDGTKVGFAQASALSLTRVVPDEHVDVDAHKLGAVSAPRGRGGGVWGSVRKFLARPARCGTGGHMTKWDPVNLSKRTIPRPMAIM